MNLHKRINSGIFLMDGAMGTQIQSREIPDSAWEGNDGCNELLNITAPDIIESIHEQFLAAGSDALSTNTFGASSITLDEYDMGERAVEINRAAAKLARQAADKFNTAEKPRFVFGSVGPGTKLPTLGQMKFDRLTAALTEQMSALLEGGVDGILLETCQDLLQIKAGLNAFENSAGLDSGIPLYVSVTVEQTGTLLVGSTIAAVVATLAPYPITILGINCATGPDAMLNHLDYLKANWPGFIACMPNAGLPELRDGQVYYPLAAEDFAERLSNLTKECGINVVGGCCGTTAEHIAALSRNLNDFSAPERDIKAPLQVSSVFGPMDLDQEPPPLYIGERANATGSKKFREALLADDYEACFHILSVQEENGAHLLDLSCAYAGRDELADMTHLVERAARECRLPLMIDSTQADVVEASLKLYGGRTFINSINFESGEERSEQIVALARRYGAALVALTIDEVGMAMDSDQKFAIAERLVKFCENRGINRNQLLIDPLTFTICSGDENLRTAALETLEAIRRIHHDLGVRTLLGLSNISFGLKADSRKVLNSVFLHRCLEVGLDSCIINVAGILPLNQIPEDAVAAATALIDNDQSNGDPLESYIQFFDDAPPMENEEEEAALPAEERLQHGIVKGRLANLEEVISELLERHVAEDILNKQLIPAMKEVGRLFNDGILQLPFVLKSAEMMKRSVDQLKPFFAKEESESEKGCMIIATVAGDVHDIGKNLVNIILSNNGFKVVDLGTKCSIETMIAAIKEHNAHALGMSGLLVKSAAIMAENMKIMKKAGIDVPVLLGGAALTPGYVADTCQPLFNNAVRYCKDAFAGLSTMRELMDNGKLSHTPPAPPKVKRAPIPQEEEIVLHDLVVVEPPFIGHRIVRNIPLEDIYPHLDLESLIRGQWRFRQNDMDKEAYAAFREKEVYPLLEQYKAAALKSGVLAPMVAYGFYHCKSNGNDLIVDTPEGPVTFTFPRRSLAPTLALADYFNPEGDIVGFVACSLGDGHEKETERLLKEDKYQEYFLTHGFSVEVVEALTAYWHQVMQEELKLWNGEEGRGARYGFGYSSCPDLAMNGTAINIIHAKEIGMCVSESSMLMPELTTCAMVTFHPQAKYFNIDTDD